MAGALARPECRAEHDVIPTTMSDLGAAALAHRCTAVSFEGLRQWKSWRFALLAATLNNR